MIGNHNEFFLELSCRVAYYRKKRNMSQQELGKLIRCSVNEIKMLECDGVSEKVCGEAWVLVLSHYVQKLPGIPVHE